MFKFFRVVIFLSFFVVINSDVTASDKNGLFVSIGQSWKADIPTVNNLAIAYEKNSYRLEWAYRGIYSRTAYFNSNPEWRNVLNIIEPHNKISVTRRVANYSFNDDLDFYFDFGLSWVDKLSDVNSSRFLFRENLGVRYQMARLFFSHTSNAGLKGRNTGEDAVNFEIKVSF